MISEKYIPKKTYEKIVNLMPIPTVDVLLFTTDLKKVLLFQRKNEPAKGEYYSIGGRLNKGESIVECAKRKLMEEAGLKTSDKDLIFIGVQNEIFSNCSFSNGVSAHCLNIYYAMIYGDEMRVRLDNQHENHKWFDLEDLNIHEYMKTKIGRSKEVLDGTKF